jgi:dTDP-4-dehydrorhamnose reductase
VRALLVSPTGFLGAAIDRHCRTPGIDLFGNARSQVSEDRQATPHGSAPEHIKLDLAGARRPEVAELLRARRITHVLVCAAVTDVDACERDRAKSRAVNVDGTREFLAATRDIGAIPVFFSSDYVFDGSRDGYAEADSPCPTTEYGRQKLETERWIREHFGRHLIFRTSKLMSMDLSPRSILADAAARLRKGEPFACPEDQWITPVYIEDVARSVEVALKRGLSGTFHLATRELVTRLEVVKRVALEIGSDPSLARPCRVADLKTLVPRACHNSLDSQAFERAADFKFRELADGLEFLREGVVPDRSSAFRNF